VSMRYSGTSLAGSLAATCHVVSSSHDLVLTISIPRVESTWEPPTLALGKHVVSLDERRIWRSGGIAS
jgi:hypothetical protein